MTSSHDLGSLLFATPCFEDFVSRFLPFSRSLNRRIYPGPNLWSTSLPQPTTMIFFRLWPSGILPLYLFISGVHFLRNTWISSLCPVGSNGLAPLHSSQLREDCPLLYANLPDSLSPGLFDLSPPLS
jgi:hypothetical protein